MAKTKTIAKGCPKCDQQVPVACKACPCGHSFFNARRNSLNLIKSPPSPESGTMRTRRTNRIKREKPNYYDSLEFEKQTRKTVRLRRSAEVAEINTDIRRLSSQKQKKKGKGRPKSGGSSGNGDDDEEMERICSYPPEKQLTCSLILQELSNKMSNVAWKPL